MAKPPKSSALEFSDYHINVNTILPGVIATPINQEMLADETISQRYQERIPLKRPGSPDELAKPAFFLSSPDASYIKRQY
ncbi:SDR family NAD(P)-dependent oxidoreductase [Bombilactobacillus mellis]|uniref:SDR family NAD(P)-dependent oxidoreductase n=1 Tax=Bombilactobacillus mellis TaxID=1218508 RepID=UPI000A05EC84|nr:SDR family oxidoreductase [Bombilactobacillus mellis]